MDVIRVCSPLGSSIFSAYGYGEWRKIITDFSVVSYGDTCRFKVLFSSAPVPDLWGQGHGLLKKAIVLVGDISSPTRHFVLVHKIHWKFSALLHVPAKVYVHDCLHLGLTAMWTIFQLFWRHCFQICGSFAQHWDECHPKPCCRWNIYNSSTHVKFKSRDCPSCTTFLMQDSSY